MTYEDLFKFALPPIITFLVGVFLPETLRLDLRSILTYLFFEKWRFNRYLKKQKAAKGPKFAICGFYQVDAEGRLLSSGPGLYLSNEIIKQMSLQIEASSTIRDYSKIWPAYKLRVEHVPLPKYALYIKRIRRLTDYLFQERGVAETFPIFIWGTIEQPNKVQQVYFETKKGYFFPRSLRDFAKLSHLTSNVATSLPLHECARYLAFLLFGLYQQSPVTYLGVNQRKFAEAHLLLEDGFATIRKGIDILQETATLKQAAEEHSRFFMPEYCALKGYLYEDAGDLVKAAEEYRKVLEWNLYHPYDGEGDFKRFVLRHYTLDLARRTLAEKVKESSNNETQDALNRVEMAEKLFIHDNTYPTPAIDLLLASILRMPENQYQEALKHFEILSQRYPDSAIPRMYWGEALKLFHSEPFRPNLSNLDLAVEKYHEAENIDPSWEIIKVKIAMGYLFKKAYGLGGQETEEKLQAYIKKSRDFYEHPELKKFLGNEPIFRTN